MEREYTIDSAHLRTTQDCFLKRRGGPLLPTLVIAVLSGFFSAGTAADELSLLVNGKAIHINPPAGRNLNESNWGLGFQYDGQIVNKKWIPFVTASGFKDSNRNPSYYAGGGVLRRFQGNDLHADVGVIAFAMTRKDFKRNRPFLGALPAFSVGTEHVSVNMTYIPKVHPKAVPLWFFQLKIKLKNF